MRLSIFGSTVYDTVLPARSSKETGRSRSFYGLSSPRVHDIQGRTLTSVKSEGSGTVRKRLAEELAGKKLPPAPRHSRNPTQAHDSSDESGGEDDIVVRIDSPSGLSFRHAT